MKFFTKVISTVAALMLLANGLVFAVDLSIPPEYWTQPKPLTKQMVETSILHSFPLASGDRTADDQAVTREEVRAAVKNLDALAKQGESIDTYSGMFFFVDKSSTDALYYYEQVIDGVYYSGELKLVEIAGNGALYRGELRGYKVENVLQQVYRQKK